MRWIKFLIVLFLGLFSSYFACAENLKQEADNTIVELFSNGQNEILLKFTVNEGWHIYYQNPGEIGKPTYVENLNPENELTVTDKSVPQIVKAYELMDEYIYEKEAYWKLNAKQNQNLKFAVNFVECADLCKSQKLIFEADKLPLTSNKVWQKVKQQAQATFPLKFSADFVQKQHHISVNLPLSTISQVIPERRDVVGNESFMLEEDGDKTLIGWQNVNEQNKLENMLIVTPKQVFEIKINYDVFDWWYFVYIMLLAFFGGLILNAMPCVFPILSLKIFGIIKDYNGRRHWGNALIYTLGVLTSFLALAGILDILKESGEAVGWGFQLQSPLFVFLMLVLFMVLFLYMVGAFSFPELANTYLIKMSGANMFLTGFFAVLIASPCTGPFMGVAVGYAFMQTDLEMYAVFGSLALGYALPFALAEIYPHFLRRILPKPGEWMVKLKIWLSLPILLTCIWLASVLVAQIYSTEGINKNKLNWRSYNADDVLTEVSSGKKVFIDFTAEWCLTCMFNEKTRLNSKKFAEFIKNNEVELFKADLTESNEQYIEALNSYGRDGIPVYVYYENRNYRILPIFFAIDDLSVE